MFAATLSFGREGLAFGALPRLQKTMATPTPHSRATAAAPDDASHNDLLLRVAAAQDRAAFTALFRHFAPRLKSYLLRHGADDATAEEIIQSTFVTVWEKAASFNPQKAAAGTWIFTIARNRRIDALRREKFIGIDDDHPALKNAAAEQVEEYADRDRVAKLGAAMDILPEEQSKLVRMAFFEDKSHQAIADETRLPLGTVKSRLRLALDKLRHTFGKDGIA